MKISFFMCVIIIVMLCYHFVVTIDKDQTARIEAEGERSQIGTICQGAAALAAIIAIPCYVAGKKS